MFCSKNRVAKVSHGFRVHRFYLIICTVLLGNGCQTGQVRSNSYSQPSEVPKIKAHGDSIDGVSYALQIFRSFPSHIMMEAFPDKLQADDKGYAGVNKESWTSVGAQRKAMAGLQKSIILEDQAASIRNWKALETAFEYQQESGEFTQADIVNDRPSTARSRVTTMGFFLSEACSSLLLLQEAQSYLEREDMSSIRNALPEAKERIRRSLDYLSTEENIALMHSDDRDTNRIFFYAKAYLMCGKLTGHQRALEISSEFLNAGLSAQREDGVFLENMGADSSYQATSLLKLAEIFLFHQDPTIQAAIEKGVRWLLPKIRENGEVDVTENTRTGMGQEKIYGKTKNINYREMVLALSLVGRILQEQHIVEVADTVASYKSSKPAKNP